MDMSWVTLDRICQEKVDKEGVPRELVRNGRPLRSSADSLSDDELLAKLRELGLDVDRDGVDRLCAGALSAEEVAGFAWSSWTTRCRQGTSKTQRTIRMRRL
jgi:hypothetical protein